MTNAYNAFIDQVQRELGGHLTNLKLYEIGAMPRVCRDGVDVTAEFLADTHHRIAEARAILAKYAS